MHIYRVGAPADLKDRRIIKMLRKTRHVDSGRRHDHFEIRASWQQLLQITQQKINIEAALMGLVDDQRVVGAEISVMGQLSQQNAVGH
ncbi:MAG: Uncharacterised protein [Halieaceae bacterium]|nr:MAG: Uncharacterised protein [Halieaceae bacterium]